MEPSPATSFVMAQADILLQILIVALDTPALVSGTNERVDQRVCG